MRAFLGLAAVLWVGSQAAIAQDASVAQRVDPAPRQAAVPAAADDGDVSEARAAHDLAVAQVRLNLVRARKALRDERFDEALRLTETVQTWLRKLPAGVDVSVYELQAEGILARLARAGKLPGAPLTAGSVPPDDAATTNLAARPAGRSPSRSVRRLWNSNVPGSRSSRSTSRLCARGFRYGTPTGMGT